MLRGGAKEAVIRIRSIETTDISFCLRLSTEAGWNQTEHDWRRLFELQPESSFLAEIDAIPVGTVTACLYGSVGWVAMMLVVEKWRGRGIGRALMAQVLENLESRGVKTIRLDATPMWQPLYELLEFGAEYS